MSSIVKAKSEAVPSEAPIGTIRHRVVILGGGFGGVHVAKELERLCGGRTCDEVEITLVSRDNFFLVTPLLFEAFSGALELMHCSVPIRAFLKRAKFVEGSVSGGIDLDAKRVRVGTTSGARWLHYDQLVLALGAWTNEKLIPGTEYALTFKTVADALILRNHVIERFERAAAEPDPALRRTLLTFVVIGGGLVGSELMGELSAFAEDILHLYAPIRRDELRFFLFQNAARIMPEVDERLSRYAEALLMSRQGVEIRTLTRVRAIERYAVLLDGERIDAATIVLAAGTVPSPVTASLPLERTRYGHVVTDAALRTSEPGVWALGDCAATPAPNGGTHPYLAQHAVREAKQLARNIHAVLYGRAPAPLMFETLGVMAAFGHRRGLALVGPLRFRGLFAWWLRRTYYLLQTPGWERRLRIVVDWTLALFLNPDVVKVDVADERALRTRETPSGAAGL